MKRPVIRGDGKRYESALDAAKALNFEGFTRSPVSMAPNIRAACNSQTRTSYGYKWRYEDMPPTEQSKPSKPKGLYGITNIKMDHDEWKRFKATCVHRHILMCDAAVEALKMWMEA